MHSFIVQIIKKPSIYHLQEKFDTENRKKNQNLKRGKIGTVKLLHGLLVATLNIVGWEMQQRGKVNCFIRSLNGLITI